MSDTLSPSRRSKRVRSGSAGDGSEASRSPPRAIRSPEQKRNKNGNLLTKVYHFHDSYLINPA